MKHAVNIIGIVMLYGFAVLLLLSFLGGVSIPEKNFLLFLGAFLLVSFTMFFLLNNQENRPVYTDSFLGFYVVYSILFLPAHIIVGFFLLRFVPYENLELTIAALVTDVVFFSFGVYQLRKIYSMLCVRAHPM